MQKLKRLVTVGVLSVGIVAGAFGMTGIVGDASANTHHDWRTSEQLPNRPFPFTAQHQVREPLDLVLRKAGGEEKLEASLSTGAFSGKRQGVGSSVH
jgi:hypothetical protein